MSERRPANVLPLHVFLRRMVSMETIGEVVVKALQFSLNTIFGKVAEMSPYIAKTRILPNAIKSKKLAVVCSIAWIFSFLFIGPAVATAQIDMFGVASSEEATMPDKVLKEFLEDKVNQLKIEYKPTGYSGVIDKLVSAGEKSYLARTTPYAFVVAELLGARMQVLAVYKSKATQTTTYNTYFVVNRKDFPQQHSPPTLSDLVDFLKAEGSKKEPAKFIYHSKYSTSSYFLPSLFFRDQEIYSMAAPSSKLIRIESKQSGKSSTVLVKAVAEGEKTFAAVWDGTKAKFEPGGKEFAEYGSMIHFIPLPTKLPNDLLVSSRSLKYTKGIVESIKGMTEEEFSSYAGNRDLDDFVSWIAIDAKKDEQGDQARKAQRALTHLRNIARPGTRSVIVDIQSSGENPFSADHIDAAKQAVKLSGTELMVKDDNQHARSDITWQIRAIHDEAIMLTSFIDRHQEAEQAFQISYKKGDLKDLTKRIGDLIHSRMHRIRYIWPYQSPPIVIRDIPFPIENQVSVEKVNWIDPEKNAYVDDTPFIRKVTNVDFSKFELEDFTEGHKDFNDPMSNISYRVVLKRPEEENMILRVLTVIYVALMVFSAGFAVYDFTRRT